MSAPYYLYPKKQKHAYMIRRITNEEYVKRIGSMNAKEKVSLAERVGEWLDNKAPLLARRAAEPHARMQSVMQLSVDWNDAEQTAFMEGARLLTAFMGVADTWLPVMIYTKAARRSIIRMVDILQSQATRITAKPVSAPDPSPTTQQPTPAPQQPVKRKRGRPKGSTKKAKEEANPQSSNLNSQTIADAVIPRPKHIDQYAHLLPEATQQRAAQYGPLMRDLEAARQNMRLLMDDTHATATERERWAKTAVRLDDRIGNIRKELDEEWNKVVATGRVVIDDFGMAHILDPATGKVNDPQPKVDFKGVDDKPKPKEDDKPKRSHHKQLTDEEKAKRTVYLQKWLRDRRPTASDEHRKQWEANARELIRLGGHLTDSMRQTGEHYGARIPKAKR